MKVSFVLLPTLLALSTCAVTLDVPCLPTSAFADREAFGDTSIPPSACRDLRSFRIQLSFYATPTNNVQLAFGRDTEPLDGCLAAEETAFIIGWDSGNWFLRPVGLKERLTFVPTDAQTARRRTLIASIRVNTQGTPTAVVFEDDAGAFTFDGFSLTPPPSWLVPKDWGLLRVTVRGADVAEEDVMVRFLPDGTLVIIN